ncbi:hypothetical protein NC651_014685 [Populus alba x Populus x berolinensis]|nr:hypothetical protein NC651_014685 [Populus alba x Populus x berolinensis]
MGSPQFLLPSISSLHPSTSLSALIWVHFKNQLSLHCRECNWSYIFTAAFELIRNNARYYLYLKGCSIRGILALPDWSHVNIVTQLGKPIQQRSQGFNQDFIEGFEMNRSALVNALGAIALGAPIGITQGKLTGIF